MNTPAPASAFAAGLVLQGRYRLDEPLAVGGMAEVWRGHDLVLERPVAVKLLHPHLASDPHLVERFRTEAVAAARLSHPNIVPTYDTGTDNGVTYIVLGLVHGPTLAELLDKGPLDARTAVSIARQVADALHHAHLAGIVHRDIKPANILIVGDDHRVMVGDFGIAKAVAESSDESLTMPGLVIGTPAYLAPEQASGAGADARTDVYATGILLHEMMSGSPNVEESTRALPQAGTLTSPPEVGAAPMGIAEVIAKATAEDPSLRQQSADELSGELSRLERAYTESERQKVPQRVAMPRPRAPRQAAPTPAPTGAPVASDEATAEHVAIPAQPVQNAAISRDASRPRSQAGLQPTVSHPYRQPSPRSARTKRIWIAIAVVLIILAIALGRMLSVISNNGANTTSTSAAPLVFTSVTSFDPVPGDGTENDSQLPNIIDSDPSTTWATQSYATRKFGNLKPGVGVVLELPTATVLRSLQIDTASNDWAAQIYVAEAPQSSLAAWGKPIDTQSGLGSSARFDLHQTQGKSVLIWFTDLGAANRLTVGNAAINP